ncbi:hypothetical protein X777_10652 [Ooceraea biroi]|uniref:Uncharacterized protein n=1 Tax=Ooceraea biroi TaxID=2015173 RepID=A0A026W5Z4_OOCBI|nr:hypothetical protein X777_10652 [Ooceraea biroi]
MTRVDASRDRVLRRTTYSSDEDDDDDDDDDGNGGDDVEDTTTTTAVGGGQSAWNEVRPWPQASARCALFRPSVLDGKLAAVGVLAEPSTLCERALAARRTDFAAADMSRGPREPSCGQGTVIICDTPIYRSRVSSIRDP